MGAKMKYKQTLKEISNKLIESKKQVEGLKDEKFNNDNENKGMTKRF